MRAQGAAPVGGTTGHGNIDGSDAKNNLADATGASQHRAEFEQRLVDLEHRIEAAKTDVWLAEHERDQVRFQLRRLLNRETPE